MGLAGVAVTRQSLQSYLHWLIWLCMAPLVAFGLLIAAETMRRVHQEQHDNSGTFAAAVAMQVDADLARRIHGLQTLGSEATANGERQTADRLHTLARRYDTAFNSPVFFAIADRTMLLHSRRGLGDALPKVPQAPARSALVDAINSGEAKVSDVITSQVINKKVIALAHPIRINAAPVIIAMTVELDYYRDMLKSLGFPAGWSVAITDSVGQSIANFSLDEDLAHKYLLPLTPIATTSLLNAGWSVSVQPTAWTFYAPHLGAALILVGALGVTLLATWWGARRSSRYLYDQIKGLAYAARLKSEPAVISHTTPSAHIAVPRIAREIEEIEEVRDAILTGHAARHAALEGERKRIARDLHDGMQQNLAVMQIDLELAQCKIRRYDKDIADSLTQLRTGAIKLIEELSRIVQDLRPPALDEIGLCAAVEQLAQRVSSACGMDVELDFAGEDAEFAQLPLPISECLYRLAQECLTNVRKHAHAQFVYVLIDITDPRVYKLQVSDDGRGFPSDQPDKPSAFGVLGMKERVAALGGWLNVRSSQTADSEFTTTVWAALPRTQ